MELLISILELDCEPENYIHFSICPSLSLLQMNSAVLNNELAMVM